MFSIIVRPHFDNQPLSSQIKSQKIAPSRKRLGFRKYEVRSSNGNESTQQFSDIFRWPSTSFSVIQQISELSKLTKQIKKLVVILFNFIYILYIYHLIADCSISAVFLCTIQILSRSHFVYFHPSRIVVDHHIS